MKQVLLCLMFVLSLGCVVAKADTVYTVQRGESLESIAEKFNISKSDLISANPKAETLFYVGMKLNIPESVSSSAVTNVDGVGLYENNGETSDAQSTAGESVISEDSEQQKPGTEIAIKLSYGFLKGANSAFAYSFTIGGNYWFQQVKSGLFAGVMIGYDSSTFTTSTRIDRTTYSTKFESHFITLPISAGYRIKIYKIFGITPYVGFSPKYCVAAKSEVNKTKYDVDKEFAIDFNAGISLNFGDFNVFGSVSVPLNDAQKSYFGKDSFFSVGIGYGI